MEKVIYENIKNGKRGTIIKEDTKAKTVILQLEDGTNVPYTTSTLKRWWKRVDLQEAEVQEETTVQEVEHIEEETTSTSETKKKEVETANSPKQAKRTNSKKSSNTKKTSGPDAEVLSYIKEHTEEVGLIEMVNHNRTLIYGTVRPSGKLGRHIRFYIGNSTIRVRLKNTESNIKWLTTRGYEYEIIATRTSLPVSIYVEVKKLSKLDKFIKQCVRG